MEAKNNNNTWQTVDCVPTYAVLREKSGERIIPAVEIRNGCIDWDYNF